MSTLFQENIQHDHEIIVEDEPDIDKNPQIINQDSDELKYFKQSINNAKICLQHHGDYSFYCVNDKKICCVDCIQKLNTHKNHNVLPIKKSFHILKDENQNFKKDCKDQIVTLEEQQKQLKHLQQQYNSDMINAQEQVSKEFSYLYNLIKTREEQLYNKLKQIYCSVIDETEKRINEIQYIKNCLKDFKSLDCQNQQVDVTIYMYSVQNALKKILKPLLNDSLTSLNSHKKQNNIFVYFGSNKLQIQKDINNFGKLVSKISSKIDENNSKSPQKDKKNSQKQTINNKSKVPQNSYISPQKKLQKYKSTEKLNGFIQKNDELLFEDQDKNFLIDNEIQKQQFLLNIQKLLKPATTYDSGEYQDIFNQIPSRPEEVSPQNNEILENKQSIEDQQQNNTKNILVDEQKQLQISNIQNFNIKSEEFSFKESNIIGEQLISSLNLVFPPNLTNIRLLYRMTFHGQKSQTIHQLCDNISPHLVVVKAQNNIFGYFNDKSIQQSEKYVSSDNSWIYSLVNNHNVGPQKFMIKSEKKFISLYQSHKSPCLGSTLQNKQDLYINYDEPSKSCSNIGHAYEYQIKNIPSNIFLAGSQTNWDIDEIEIYTFNF